MTPEIQAEYCRKEKDRIGLSTVQGAVYWKKWEQNPGRLIIDTEIQTLLEETPRISIYTSG